MSKRTLFIISAAFAVINLAAFLVNLYVVLYDTPDSFTYPNLYIVNPASLLLAVAGMLYARS